MQPDIITILENTFGKLETKLPTYVDYGYANEVYLLPTDKLVVRMPRNSWAAMRQINEAKLLQMLESIDLGYEISRLRLLCQKPDFMVTSYVAGDVYSREMIFGWEQVTLIDFGRDLGEFLWQLHSLTQPQIFATIISEKPALIQEFHRDIFESYPDGVDPIFAVAKKEFQNLIEGMNRVTIKFVVLHSDIHAANLVFDESKRLKGVLDFAEMSIGGVYEDLRRVYMLHPLVFESCLDNYQVLSGEIIDRELVKQWAIVHELSVLCKHYEEPNYASIPRARAHLKSWISLN